MTARGHPRYFPEDDHALTKLYYGRKIRKNGPQFRAEGVKKSPGAHREDRKKRTRLQDSVSNCCNISDVVVLFRRAEEDMYDSHSAMSA